MSWDEQYKRQEEDAVKGAQAGRAKPSEAKPKLTTRRKAITKELSREEIERRAYELYLARGCGEGYAEEDWLQAERELRVRRSVKQ